VTGVRGRKRDQVCSCYRFVVRLVSHDGAESRGVYTFAELDALLERNKLAGAFRDISFLDTIEPDEPVRPWMPRKEEQ
jgi:hypothetical protein